MPENNFCMGPPSVAGTSSENNQPVEQPEEMLEGEDGVSYSVCLNKFD